VWWLQGVVHGDLSTDNVYYDARSKSITIIDFWKATVYGSLQLHDSRKQVLPSQ
jgi:Ser/Thr protein kinase RdoA (MazF antagonist)